MQFMIIHIRPMLLTNKHKFSVNMKIFVLSLSLCFFCFALLSYRLSAESLSGGKLERTTVPPRGWNSYDSYSWTINEEQFLANAEVVSQRLLRHGYEYVVVDYLWYRRKVKGADADSLGFDVIDEWGRMVPDPDRWPSSRDGQGFAEVAKKVHSMGLKFGIHVMRGISTQAVNANTPILDINTGRAYEENGKVLYASDIGVKERRCAWMRNGFMSVDTNLGAARAFLKSLYAQYVYWGVDFVKHDCVFGDDLDFDEIIFVSDYLNNQQREILYSISPGTNVNSAMALSVSGHVNTYRITGDDWDSWGDVASHFDISRDLASNNMIGASSLLGKSWPDMDMFPLGWLTDPASNDGPHRSCNLNIEEQRTQILLWAMAKSPFMYGGDLTKIDDITFYLISHPTILEINAFSSNNMEFPFVSGANVLTGQEHIRGSQSGRSRNNLTASVSLTRCSDPKATGWFVEVQKRARKVCWKSNNSTPFCLYKKHSTNSNVERVRGLGDHRQLFLSDTNRHELCLDSSLKRRLRSEESTGVSFSPCTGKTNQVWDLNANGTLVNSHSGQCATLNPTGANNVPTGIRGWIAEGRAGEIYVAFFNLNEDPMTMSAHVNDLAKALGERKASSPPCTCREVWTNTDYGRIMGSFSMVMDGHGSALFVLNCH